MRYLMAMHKVQEPPLDGILFATRMDIQYRKLLRPAGKQKSLDIQKAFLSHYGPAFQMAGNGAFQMAAGSLPPLLEPLRRFPVWLASWDSCGGLMVLPEWEMLPLLQDGEQYVLQGQVWSMKQKYGRR